MSESLSFRTSAEQVETLDRIAQATERPRSWHLERALRLYLNREAWHLAEIEAGLEDAREGRVIDHAQVAAWLESWGTDNELPPPE